MSAIPTPASAAPSRTTSPESGLPRRARRFYLTVLLAAAGLAVVALAAPTKIANDDWQLFALLVAGAAVAHYFVVYTAKNQLFHVGLVFTVAGSLLLPPRLILALCVLQHLGDWAKERYAWYIQTFNIANYVCAAMTAHLVATLAEPHARASLGGPDGAVLGLVACAAFVGMNHAVLAQMLKLARGWGLRDGGLFTLEALSTDFLLAAFGLTIALLWQLDPWTLAVVCAPLVLIQRALTVPQLWAEARVDVKTGLFNARHINVELDAEIARARRFRRELSVLMADLDLLRTINNRFGHLAGDDVLRGVADILRRELRDYDIAARFGGEEFLVLLPETGHDEALAIAERIRRSVEHSAFSPEHANEPLRATLSIGVATFPQHGMTAKEVVHEADLALYGAKRSGRNAVRGDSPGNLAEIGTARSAAR